LELYVKKRKPNESLKDRYQDIRRLISLACPNNVSDTSERPAINQSMNALDNENMLFEILNKNYTTLEAALHIVMRYEACKPSQSAPQGAASTEPSKTPMFLHLYTTTKAVKKIVCEHMKYT